MKMENSVVAPFDGYIERVGKGVNVEAVVGEGTLACVLEEEDGSGRQWVASNKL
jgi:biotin carboxyl carrier protein